MPKPPAFKRFSAHLLWGMALLLGGVCPLNAAGLKVLPGHVPGILSRLAPEGPLPATNQLRLAVGLAMRDPAGLESFVAAVSDPASPGFRHFLTREELTARFGPTAEDYEAVKNFAASNGLAITATHANRLLLDVTGSAVAVEKAFHITLRTYRHPTEARDFFAPDTEPMVNAALPVVDVEGLSDYFRAHPKFVKSKNKSAAQGAPKTGTAPDGSGNLFGNDFRNAYVPGVTLTGAGQSVGLFELDGFFANDISNYARLAGNGRSNILVQSNLIDSYNGKPSTGAEGAEVEVELDIEMAMAIAPGLTKIVSFEGGKDGNGNQNDVLNAMLADSNVVNLSCSWGWSGGPSNTTDTIFQSMDAVGQTFFDASGDNQAFTTGSNSVNGVDNTNLDNAPSSNPYITQVGGTTLTMNGAGASWASEVVWNWASEEDDPDVGSSGGISSHYPIPSWQTNVSNMAGRGGSTSFRNIPDVAANADHVYVIYDNGKNTNDYDGWGGTSCAAPLWAGFMALVNQQTVINGGSNSGFINPVLYAIAAGSNYASCFHDITSGSNTWSSSPKLFYATNNYDLCTGLGAMNGQSLINALIFPAVTSFTNLTASQPIPYGTTAITLAGKVSATGPIYPASGETVTITIDGNAQSTTIDDSTGDFSFSYNPDTIPASGTAYSITYSYAGDASLHPATNASTTLMVNQASLSVTANDQSKTYGQTLVFGNGSAQFTSSGLQNWETIGVVTLSCSGGASNAPVGNYPITPSGAAGGTFNPANYDITYNNGTLTVNPLAVILTGTRGYDGTAMAAFGILSVANAINSDVVTPVSGCVTLAAASVGTQSITSADTLALGGANAGNYTLNGVTGSVTITNPFNPFSITTSSLDVTGTNFVVCWQSVSGVTYNVLTNTGLGGSAPWASAGSTNATTTCTCFTLPGGIIGNTNVFVVIQQ